MSLGAAAAHVEPSARILQRVEGGIVFSAAFDAPFAVAGPILRGSGWTLRHADGAHLGEEMPTLVARGEGGVEAPVRVEATEPGHFAFEVALPTRGSWTLDVSLASGAGASLPFEAYPDHPARVEWAPDADARGVERAPARLAFTIEDVAPWTDAVLGIERWSNDRARLLGGYEIPLTVGADGRRASTMHAFNEPGSYLLYVGSPARGLEPGDRPPFEFFVDPAPSAADAADTPTPRGTPAGAAVLLGAFALGALLRRR